MSIVLRQCVLIDKKIGMKKLIAIENQVVKNITEFMNQDISSTIVSMTKLGLMPLQVIHCLKDQTTLSFLNVNETLRLMECVVDYIADNRHDELPFFADLLEKVVDNLCLKLDKLTEPKLKNTMEIFAKFAENIKIIQDLEEFDKEIIDMKFYTDSFQLILDYFESIIGDDQYKTTI